jgi:hypothetical protein
MLEKGLKKQRQEPVRNKEEKDNHGKSLNINDAPFHHHFDEDTA